MKRRDFLVAAGAAAAAGGVMLPRMAFAEPGRIDLYIGSDSNIFDFWSNTIKPAFEAANRGITVNLVDAGGDMAAIGDRALAALQAHADPQADFFDAYDPHLPIGGIEAGLWVDMTKAGLSNFDKVNPLAKNSDFSLPYRGSQVLLAYDTTKLSAADAPRTWDALVAWIKANPGQFIYNRPDKGGAGGNFVKRAIHQANNLDPKLFTLDNYTPEYGAEALGKAWELLADIAPSLFDGGSYTAGNTQSILLLAQSAVTMVPVWSDQTLQAISQGVLPDTTGLVQLQDLGLCGDFSRIAIPSNATNKDAALKLADFILTPAIQIAILTELGGFPGIAWDYLPAELHDRFADVVATTIPTFPGGPWTAPINDGWYRNVAPNLDRAA